MITFEKIHFRQKIYTVFKTGNEVDYLKIE